MTVRIAWDVTATEAQRLDFMNADELQFVEYAMDALGSQLAGRRLSVLYELAGRMMAAALTAAHHGDCCPGQALNEILARGLDAANGQDYLVEFLRQRRADRLA